MRHVYMHITWKTEAKRKGNQVVPIRNITRKISRRGRRSGNGKKIRRQKPLHINEKIPRTIEI
jgi:hypothetical protein